MTISEMRTACGMSQSEFGKLLNVPKRTIERWEYRKSCPGYTEHLIEYFLRHEGYIK